MLSSQSTVVVHREGPRCPEQDFALVLPLLSVVLAFVFGFCDSCQIPWLLTDVLKWLPGSRVPCHLPRGDGLLGILRASMAGPWALGLLRQFHLLALSSAFSLLPSGVTTSCLRSQAGAPCSSFPSLYNPLGYPHEFN